MRNDPADSLTLVLLSREAPRWDLDALSLRCGDDLVSVHNATIRIAPRSLGDTPPTVEVGPPVAPDQASLGIAASQTWDWPEAAAMVEQCRCATSISDRFSRHLPYKDRWRRLRFIAAAAMSSADFRGCLAVHAPACRRLVDPAAFLQGEESGGDVLCGAVNVRLFEVADHGTGCLLMDTLGLSSLGLPDLQCVLRGIDPNDVAATLWDYAYYLFEKGDVIEDGHLVKGIEDGAHWTCGRQEALAEPRRIVLDLFPGPEHAPL